MGGAWLHPPLLLRLFWLGAQRSHLVSPRHWPLPRKPQMTLTLMATFNGQVMSLVWIILITLHLIRPLPLTHPLAVPLQFPLLQAPPHWLYPWPLPPRQWSIQHLLHSSLQALMSSNSCVISVAWFAVSLTLWLESNHPSTLPLPILGPLIMCFPTSWHSSHTRPSLISKFGWALILSFQSRTADPPSSPQWSVCLSP